MADGMSTTGGLLVKALMVRLTAVLADGRTVRFETGHPAQVSLEMMRGEEMALSEVEPLTGTSRDRVHLIIDQAAPYTVQSATPHRQATVTWNPRRAYEEWHETRQWVTKDDPDPETAFQAGVAAFLDSITDPADEGRFAVTLNTRDGGSSTGLHDQRELARTLIQLAQAPHVIEPGDKWVIERTPRRVTPETTDRQADQLTGVLRNVLSDCGLDPDDVSVRESLRRRLNEAAKTTMGGLR